MNSFRVFNHRIWIALKFPSLENKMGLIEFFNKRGIYKTFQTVTRKYVIPIF